MPAKKSDGLFSISTSTSRASNCSERFLTKRGQSEAPGTRSRERAHHLAAVADAEREAVGAGEEGGELVARPRVEEDRPRPALAAAEHVPVREAAAGHEAREVGERDAARDQVAHVHVDRVEAGAVEGRRHLDVAVDALLAQDREPRPGAAGDEGARHVLGRVEGEAAATGPGRARPGCGRTPRARTRGCRAASASARWSRTRAAAACCAAPRRSVASPQRTRTTSSSFGAPMDERAARP